MSGAMRQVRVLQLGRMEYRGALKVQQDLVAKLKRGECMNSLVFVEHDPVYTIGIRRHKNDAEEEVRLRKLGAEFVPTNRGGLITFHGPGQLVAYPILNLAHFRNADGDTTRQKQQVVMGMRWYTNALEQTVIQALDVHFGLGAQRLPPHTGVWIGEQKVCAIGVHNSGLVTSHGIALNCNVDLSWFQHIVPCGIQGKGVTSLSAQLGRDVGLVEAQAAISHAFQEHFMCQLVS